MKPGSPTTERTLMDERIHTLPIGTADGEFVAHYSGKGLCRLEFPLRARSKGVSPAWSAVPIRVRDWHAAVTRALLDALHGREPSALPPLDLSAGSEFQRQVWEGMRRIPRGRTQSYGELARAIGRPKAVRALGGACGANPIPVFIPCHRVIAAHGRLGGFSGGLEWKRLLLSREARRSPT